MELRRKAGTGARIPTSSMADIAFLLIVFFMVTTIFKLEQGLAITLPRSTAGEKIPKENVAHIWIDRTGIISIDDLVITQVTSNEPDDGNGDGHTTDDIVLAPDGKSVDLRIERQGVGHGRVYTIIIQAVDASGNVANEPYVFEVGHDNRDK